MPPPLARSTNASSTAASGSKGGSLADRIGRSSKGGGKKVPAEANITFVEFSALVRADEPNITTEEIRARFAPFDRDGDGVISKAELVLDRIVMSVLAELAVGQRLSDMFTQWNNDDSRLDKDEFLKGIRGIKSGILDKLSDEELSSVFAVLDADGTGALTFSELTAELQRVKTTGASKSAGSCLDVSVVIKAGPDSMFKLRDALKSRMQKIVNLFQEWDQDKDGSISRKEFSRAMTLLSFEAPKEVIDQLFQLMDEGGDGKISYKELVKAINKPKLLDMPSECQKCPKLEDELKAAVAARDANKERITELEAQLRRTEEEREEARREAAANRREADANRKEADDNRREADANRREADANRKEADDNRREADANRKEADANRREADANRKEADDNRSEADANRAEAVANRKEADANRREADDNWAQILELQSQLRSAEAARESARKEADAHMARIQEIEALLRNAEATRDEALAMIDERVAKAVREAILAEKEKSRIELAREIRNRCYSQLEVEQLGRQIAAERFAERSTIEAERSTLDMTLKAAEESARAAREAAAAQAVLAQHHATELSKLANERSRRLSEISFDTRLREAASFKAAEKAGAAPPKPTIMLTPPSSHQEDDRLNVYERSVEQYVVKLTSGELDELEYYRRLHR